MAKKQDITEALGAQQKKLLKDLRAQANDLTELMKLLAASQDVDAVRKEHMEFLGTMGSRTLTSKELAMAKEGIPLDELRKICGRKMLASESLMPVRDFLPKGHVLKMVYAEHDLILYYLSDLETLNTNIQQLKRWSDNRKFLDKLMHIVRILCTMDLHQTREERIIFPKLAAHGYDDILQNAFAEHDRMHKGRVEIKMLADSIGKMDFNQWKERLDEAVGIFIPAVREHIYKEDNLLYPNALKTIQDPQMWDTIKAACDDIL